MVRKVSGDDVGERPHSDWIIAGDAAPRPRLGGKSVEKRDGRGPDRLKLLNKLRPRSVVRMSVRDRDVLLETRQRVVETTREPERATQKQTLAVVYVV